MSIPRDTLTTILEVVGLIAIVTGLTMAAVWAGIVGAGAALVFLSYGLTRTEQQP